MNRGKIQQAGVKLLGMANRATSKRKAAGRTGWGRWADIRIEWGAGAGGDLGGDSLWLLAASDIGWNISRSDLSSGENSTNTGPMPSRIKCQQ